MRFFALLNTQHVAALIIVTIIFLLLFGVALAVVPLFGPLSRVLENRNVQHFAGGIKKADGPFPLINALIIAGVVLWALYYILYYGFSEVVI